MQKNSLQNWKEVLVKKMLTMVDLDEMNTALKGIRYVSLLIVGFDYEYIVSNLSFKRLIESLETQKYFIGM